MYETIVQSQGQTWSIVQAVSSVIKDAALDMLRRHPLSFDPPILIASNAILRLAMEFMLFEVWQGLGETR